VNPRSAALAGAAGLGLGLLLSATPGCGRTLSRLGLGSQKLKAPPGAKQVLGISFHPSEDGTVKDVVFVMSDCTVVAREYKDISPFEGELRILRHDGEPFRQAGCVPETPDPQ